MSTETLEMLLEGVESGTIIPYLGPGALIGSLDQEGRRAPVTQEELILELNHGQPMPPKLMYEFPRAAMNLELKHGRSYLQRFFSKLYTERQWSRSPVHEWIAAIKPAYVIDINRDTMLQDSYAAVPHTLICGISRIGGTDFRFKLFHYNGNEYHEIGQDEVNEDLPVLFKPMGTPKPEPHYIASDADYVDYISELMGGFGIPSFVKRYRASRRYLFLGLSLTRDTERMIMSDITYGSANPRGWALIPEPTEKERRFCARVNIEIIEADIEDLLRVATANQA